MNLGSAYRDRIIGDRGKNIEESIECYKKALEIQTKESLPQDWAKTQMNLGTACGSRIIGDGGENIEESIECYKKALEICTKESLPREWASTQMNLGNAYSDRIIGDRAQNIEESIECYKKALEIQTEESLPGDWAMTQMNLGTAYRNRIIGDVGQNIEESIESYKKALEIYTKESLPHKWAMTQMNLGTAYQTRIIGDVGQNIEEGIECYKNALEIYTKDSLPRDWAQTQINHAASFIQRVKDSTIENRQRALGILQQVLTIIKMEADPLLYLRACYLFATTSILSKTWHESIHDVEKAMVALKYAKSLSATGLLYSRHLDEKYADIPSILVGLHYFKAKYEKLLEEFDRTKASLLQNLISEWDEAGSEMSEERRRKLENLKNRYRILRYKADITAGKRDEYEKIVEECRNVKNEIDEVISTSFRTEKDDIRRLRSVSCDEMIAFVSKKNVIGLVLFYAPVHERMKENDFSVSLHGISMCNGKIIAHRTEEIVSENEMYESSKLFRGEKVIGESDRDYQSRREREEEVLKEMGKFISEMLSKMFPEWRSTISNRSSESSECNKCLECNNCNKCSKCNNMPNRLMIVAHRVLNSIPFSAVPIEINSDEPKLIRLGEVFNGGIWMTPSLSIAIRIDERRKEKKLLKDCKIVSATCGSVVLYEKHDSIVNDELGNKIDNGLHLQIKEPYPPRSRIKECKDVRDCDILHVTCHGLFGGGENAVDAHRNPSKLLNTTGLSFEPKPRNSRNTSDETVDNVERERKLSMTDIWEMNLEKCSVASVIACSGGVVDIMSRSDENLGIGTAFLIAGARNVICSLWLLHEIAAAGMISQCYRSMCEDPREDGEIEIENIGKHVGEAQRWMKGMDEDEYADFYEEFDTNEDTFGIDSYSWYHWGAFIIMGPPD